jgi:hypothetical protein
MATLAVNARTRWLAGFDRQHGAVGVEWSIRKDAAMIRSAAEFVRLRTSEVPTLYRKAAHETAPEEVWLEVIKKYPKMKPWVIHNKTIPHSILCLLADDEDTDVSRMRR